MTVTVFIVGRVIYYFQHNKGQFAIYSELDLTLDLTFLRSAELIINVFQFFLKQSCYVFCLITLGSEEQIANPSLSSVFHFRIRLPIAGFHMTSLKFKLQNY